MLLYTAMTVALSGTVHAVDKDWESCFAERLQWWSLQPVSKPQPPSVKEIRWPRNEVDQFILASLEEKV